MRAQAAAASTGARSGTGDPRQTATSRSQARISEHEAARARYDHATAHLDPPLAIVDLDAFDRNAADLVGRAAGRPIRVASKSLRCRYLLQRALAIPGFRGVMCYSLAEALWLHAEGTSDDILVAYPSVDKQALRALAADQAAGRHITLMIDSTAHLDLIDTLLGDGHPDLRVCLDLDASWRPIPPALIPPALISSALSIHIGTRRSPIHSPQQAAAFAKQVIQRIGFRLTAVMSYEGQIAGLGDAPPGQPARAQLLRWIQKRSAAELKQRRSEAVRLISELTPLEYVNGGGTGSLEVTAQDTAVTELSAGSGLVGGTLFDAYRRFRPEPALLFALPVVRRPGRDVATLYAGGYIASGPAGRSRQPTPYLPRGLALTGTEAAGEVQTPVRGKAASYLQPGDRVWLRHAKAGELAERFTHYYAIGAGAVEPVPTYRGEGQCFGLAAGPVDDQPRSSPHPASHPRSSRRAHPPGNESLGLAPLPGQPRHVAGLLRPDPGPAPRTSPASAQSR
jgi:D-serine deaminase-like pyridoxal phosphate-dependent protein